MTGGAPPSLPCSLQPSASARGNGRDPQLRQPLGKIARGDGGLCRIVVRHAVGERPRSLHPVFACVSLEVGELGVLALEKNASLQPVDGEIAEPGPASGEVAITLRLVVRAVELALEGEPSPESAERRSSQ